MPSGHGGASGPNRKSGIALDFFAMDGASSRGKPSQSFVGASPAPCRTTEPHPLASNGVLPSVHGLPLMPSPMATGRFGGQHVSGNSAMPVCTHAIVAGDCQGPFRFLGHPASPTDAPRFPGKPDRLALPRQPTLAGPLPSQIVVFSEGDARRSPGTSGGLRWREGSAWPSGGGAGRTCSMGSASFRSCRRFRRPSAPAGRGESRSGEEGKAAAVFPQGFSLP